MQLFENTEQCLSFAYRFQSEQYAATPMAKWMGGPIGSGKGLGGIDGAAQAGLVKRNIASLSPLHQACITARFSPKFESCRCCGGQKMLEEYKLALVVLSQFALSQFSGLSVRSLIEVIIRSYFERGVSVSAYAEEKKIALRTAADQKSKIFNALKKLDTQARGEIAELLQPMCEMNE